MDVPLYFNFFSDQLDFQTFTGNCMPILTPVSGYTEDNDSESSCISNNNLKVSHGLMFLAYPLHIEQDSVDKCFVIGIFICDTYLTLTCPRENDPSFAVPSEVAASLENGKAYVAHCLCELGRYNFD